MCPDKISRKLVKATVYTIHNFQIEGQVFTAPELRLSDEFTLGQKKHLVLKDATIRVLGTDITFKHDMVFVNKEQIVLISANE